MSVTLLQQSAGDTLTLPNPLVGETLQATLNLSRRQDTVTATKHRTTYWRDEKQPLQVLMGYTFALDDCEDFDTYMASHLAHQHWQFTEHNEVLFLNVFIDGIFKAQTGLSKYELAFTVHRTPVFVNSLTTLTSQVDTVTTPKTKIYAGTSLSADKLFLPAPVFGNATNFGNDVVNKLAIDGSRYLYQRQGFTTFDVVFENVSWSEELLLYIHKHFGKTMNVSFVSVGETSWLNGWWQGAFFSDPIDFIFNKDNEVSFSLSFLGVQL